MTISERDLADYLGIEEKKLSAEEQIDEIADKLVERRAALEFLKEEIVRLENEIIVLTEEEPGEVEVRGNKKKITVARSELWNWDSDKIEDKIVTVPPPKDFISVKYSINKSKFQSAPAAEQADFLDALTRKPGKPRLKIEDI